MHSAVCARRMDIIIHEALQVIQYLLHVDHIAHTSHSLIADVGMILPQYFQNLQQGPMKIRAILVPALFARL